jgi:hypothetical protein
MIFFKKVVLKIGNFRLYINEGGRYMQNTNEEILKEIRETRKQIQDLRHQLATAYLNFIESQRYRYEVEQSVSKIAGIK